MYTKQMAEIAVRNWLEHRGLKITDEEVMRNICDDVADWFQDHVYEVIADAYFEHKGSVG